MIHLVLLSSMLIAGTGPGARPPHLTTLIETTTIEVLSGLHILLSLRRRVEFEERWPATTGTAPHSGGSNNSGDDDSSGRTRRRAGAQSAATTVSIAVPLFLVAIGVVSVKAEANGIARPPNAVGEGWILGDALFTWCEPDTWTPAAEFHNTWSNLPYCIVGLITMHSAGQLPALAPLRLVGLMLVAIGVGSMLFHGTLTRIGQAADELAIMWWEISMMLLLYPARYRLIWTLFVIETSCYWLMDLYPEVGWLLYHPAHTAVDLLVVYGVYVEAVSTGQLDTQKCVKWGLGLIAVAGTAWGIDFVHCDATQHLHLHAYGWHFFSCAAITMLHIALALILLRRDNQAELPILFAKFKLD